jgi:hypothetical protein
MNDTVIALCSYFSVFHLHLQTFLLNIDKPYDDFSCLQSEFSSTLHHIAYNVLCLVDDAMMKAAELEKTKGQDCTLKINM